MHAYNGVFTILGLACFFSFCVFVKVKLTVPFLCAIPEMTVYCVGLDVKPYSSHSLTHGL